MDLSSITPLILTYNEAPNIGRTLERLQWAEQVVVIDSYSTDETEGIAKGFGKGFENVCWVQRNFDDHTYAARFSRVPGSAGGDVSPRN